MNRITAPRTLVGLALAAALTVGLSACSSSTSPTPASTPSGSAVPTATSAPTASSGSDVAPVAATTPAPVPSPSITADAYSQVVAGKLYQGTELAPVRIGTDTPGQVPAAQAQLQRGTSEKLAASANKYLVYVLPIAGKGWAWKVFGEDQWGNMMEIGGSGYREGLYIATRAAAIAGPFVVDGRSLDRAEFILAAEN